MITIENKIDKEFENLPIHNKELIKTLFYADPTAKNGNCGKYHRFISKWIKQGLVIDESTTEERITPDACIDLFLIMSNKLPFYHQHQNLFENHIEYFNKPEDFIKEVDKMEVFLENNPLPDDKVIIGNESNIILDDKDFFIVEPLTWRASRHYGGDTKWCTASSNPITFGQYVRLGRLFIIQNKKTKRKFQIFYTEEGGITEFRDNRNYRLKTENYKPMINIFFDNTKL